jgi:hypothetical protein
MEFRLHSMEPGLLLPCDALHFSTSNLVGMNDFRFPYVLVRLVR